VGFGGDRLRRGGRRRAPASERGPELLAYASCLLELGRIDEVLAVLGDVDEGRSTSWTSA
jgi:hypothetical protein